MKNYLTSRYKYIHSYDIVKCIACIMMIIDHVGLFFAPQFPLLRIIGRFAFPLFFFVSGHKKAFSLSFSLCLGASLLTFISFFSPLSFFPLNALWSMLISRALFHFVKEGFLQKNREIIYLLCLLCFPVTNLFWEYGSFGLLFMALGYEKRDNSLFFPYLLSFSWISYLGAECMLFDFSGKETTIFALLTLLTGCYLSYFESKSYICPSKMICYLVSHISTHSLLIYIVHFSIFLAIYTRKTEILHVLS